MEEYHNSSECIESVVGGDDYNQGQVNKWTASIVERCLTQLVKQGKPYNDVCCDAENRSRPPHSELLLLGHHPGW
ncbi:hypothetical protein PAMP_016695 [Pampus punctatissimus]